MTSYTVIVQEEDPQLSQLSQNHYNLQVAKAVSSGGGPPQFTMVYMSTVLAPVMSIGWTVTYGLNWTTEIPSPGASVIYGGRWQQCDFGSSYDLNETGSWSVNNNDSNKDSKSLNVGRNGYSEAVHMMVGVKNTHGEWKPIFVDKDALLPNMHGNYKPIERVKLWWQEKLITSTMISNQASDAKEADLGNPTTYFSYADNKWKDPQNGSFF